MRDTGERMNNMDLNERINMYNDGELVAENVTVKHTIETNQYDPFVVDMCEVLRYGDRSYDV